MPLVKKWQLDEHEDDSDIHHREWGWADEQSWRKAFVLPFAGQYGWARYTGNPIFEASGQVNTFDRYYVSDPCVVRVGDTYYLFYDAKGDVTGGDNTDGEMYGLGVASSTSPYGPWTRSANNPILTVGTSGAWDGLRVNIPCVIYDHYETDSNKKWKIIYCGVATGPVRKLGYAYASDPEGPWTKHVGNPVISADVHFGHGFLRAGLLYYDVHASSDRANLVLEISKDCESWTTYGDVLAKGSAGEWDVNEMMFCTVFWNLGTWYLFYTGKGASAINRIGMALDFMGALEWGTTRTFIKYARNPVLNYASNQWDHYIRNPNLIMVEDKFYMYYCGFDNNWANGKIGVATIP